VLGIFTWIIFEIYETEWPSLVPATIVSFLGMIAGSLVWPRKEQAHDKNRTQPIE
jgi:SSS family solute:Na+ symporter